MVLDFFLVMHTLSPDFCDANTPRFVVFTPHVCLHLVPDEHHHQEEPLEAQAQEGEPEVDWSFTGTARQEIFADIQAFNEDNREDVDGAEEKPEKVKHHEKCVDI